MKNDIKQFLLAGMSFFALACNATAATRPNIIFFLADDQRHSHEGEGRDHSAHSVKILQSLNNRIIRWKILNLTFGNGAQNV